MKSTFSKCSQKVVRSKVAAKKWLQYVNANNAQPLSIFLALTYSHFLAITFDFTTLSPRLLKAAPFFTAWLFCVENNVYTSNISRRFI